MFGVAPTARAQGGPPMLANDPGGRITGKVLDMHETGVAGAEVFAKSNASGQEFTTASGENGSFNFAELRLGEYSLTAARLGFKSRTIKNVRVGVEATMVEMLLEGGPATSAENVATTARKNYRFLQSNGLLIEEAYHQETGEVQHTFRATRERNGLWTSAFSQEWPLWSEKHQLSVTMPMQLAANDLDGGGRGIGDIEIGYSYFLLGNNDSRVTVSPSVSLILPTGNVGNGLGKGAPGLEVKVPVSVMLSEHFVTHTNVGTTLTRAAKNREGERGNLFDVEAGQGLVWLAHPKFNVLMDVIWARAEAVAAKGLSEREYEFTISPGIRWAHTFKGGLAIIPGVAVPIGFGPSRGNRGMFFRLAVEHSFKKQSE